jgi:uncharacterized membrane protein
MRCRAGRVAAAAVGVVLVVGVIGIVMARGGAVVGSPPTWWHDPPLQRGMSAAAPEDARATSGRPALVPRSAIGRLPSSASVDAEQDDNIPGIDRLLALTDGVVAIALTLLVLQLQVPVTKALENNPDSARSLWRALDVDGAEFTSYLVSFLVIAQFWLVHHRILRSMRGHSEALAWRNFFFLLALTLMPFTSDLLGRYGNNPLAITFFAVNLVAISLSTQWIYLYAARHDLLVDAQRSAHEELTARVRVVLTLCVVGIALLLAWTRPGLAKYVWICFLFLPALGTRIATALEANRRPGVAPGV